MFRFFLKSSFVIKTALRLNIIHQISFMLRFSGKILVYKKLNSDINRSSNIKVKAGVFSLGKAWLNGCSGNNQLRLANKSNIVVESDFIIYDNFKIILNEGAVLELGSGYINSQLDLECFSSIKIGFGVAIGPKFTIRDGDSKKLYQEGEFLNQNRPIVIGDRVWIGTGVTILKGCVIGDGAVIASGAVVTGDVDENTLVGGVPARVIRRNVRWES